MANNSTNFLTKSEKVWLFVISIIISILIVRFIIPQEWVDNFLSRIAAYAILTGVIQYSYTKATGKKWGK